MPTTYLVRTTSGDLTRDGKIVATNKATAARKALSDHRARLLELGTAGLDDDIAVAVAQGDQVYEAACRRAKRNAVINAVSRSILVAKIEVIESRKPQVGDVFPRDAA